MKTQIISRISGCFLSILLVSSSFSQEQDFKELPPITVTATSSNVSVTARINKAFEEYFKSVTHLRWYQADKNFLAKFIQNDQANTALFTKNGILVYHISTGMEKHLPSEVRKLVKSTYFDYNIRTILKVFQNNRTVWVVNMEDDKNWVIVHVEDDEMAEVKKYKKA